MMQAQNGYSDHNTLAKRLEAISVSNPSLCRLTSIARTAGGKDIHVVTIGIGETGSKPGIAVLGGIEGNYLLGREIAVRLAELLVKGHESLLSEVTFYIFPDVSPDATAQFFAPVRYERTVNASQTDDDRDFTSDEDPYDDLDKDGIITHVRVYDPAGTFTTNTNDQRVMNKADISKGQTGGFIYFTEGIDNDKDGKFNEDGTGGVNFNRNFTFDYEEFGLNAGLHPVSEKEVKSVADFLYDRFNIFAVFSFGPQDNLGQPLKNSPKGQDGRITSILPSDEIVNKLVSDRYHEITGLKGTPDTKKTPGNFMDWAYYHYGRYSFGSPGWWFPVGKDENQEAAFLNYAEKSNIKDVFIPWKEINHPDYPGRKAETGGIKPFVMINPPPDSINVITEKHANFIMSVAALHPGLEFTDVKQENIGDDIFRLELKVHNKGVFATMTEVAENNIWTRIMRLALEPAKGQEILSGRKVQRISRLTGGESAEFSWLVRGKGPLEITAGAVNTGIITSTINLR